MKTTSELFLTFLLNACWQIGLIAVVTAIGDRFLRRTIAGYRHLLWVAALMLSLLLPSLTSFGSFISSPLSVPPRQEITVTPLPITEISESGSQVIGNGANSVLHTNESIALGLLAAYLLFLSYKGFKLFRAWARTRAVPIGAPPLEPNDPTQTIVARCRKIFGIGTVTVLSSSSLQVPITLGVFRPVVVLPDRLLRDGNANVLTAAIGHEMVHVSRRDYLLNLIYELISLPLSFHPAAVLMKRRITQTRELRCDEVVAEQLLQPEIYARSLVRLAGSAMRSTRRAQTIAVGIADADILEVRIMSLLKRTKLNVSRKRVWLIAAGLLLIIPCAAAASFGFHFNVDPVGARLVAQEPSREAQEKREARSREEREMKERAEREDRELIERIEREPNPEIKAKLKAALERRKEERAKSFEYGGFEYKMRSEGWAKEREIEAKQQAELARWAKISMDQAIQIARSQQPGKVIECSLIGEHWEEPGKLAKDGQVYYHVVILSGDEAKQVTTHVLVNAVDGTIFKTKREGPGDYQDDDAISGGMLNGKALSLPNPEYPEVAKAAHASGLVTVVITIDEDGNVVAARAKSGHPLLQAAAVSAAREAKFSPTRVNGEPVKVKGIITYNFVDQ